MSNYLKMWTGVGVLVIFSVIYYFVGRGVWGEAFAPNYAASMAGAALGGALSLIVVMISLTITRRQSREKDLSHARFAFLRRRGEELWQTYIAFSQSLGMNTSNITGATWNSADPKLWPSESKASEINYLLKNHVSNFCDSPGSSTLSLRNAYDQVFDAVSDTAIFEGEHSLAKDITEAWRHFGWASVKIQEYQSRIGWTPQNWPDISKEIEQTSESVSKTIASLASLSKKITIK